MDIKYLIQDYLKCNSFQEFINNRFRDDTKHIISFEHIDKKIIDIINRERNYYLMHPIEALQIYNAVKSTEKLHGGVAEVGVYRGGSASIICEAKGTKKLYLFDTFCGLPDVLPIDSENPSVNFHKGDFSCSLESVKTKLNSYNNVFFYQGIFPTTAYPIKDISFSFVNLDVDIYESTYNSLDFFYPRMVKGGILISHDYNGADGVKLAFDNFFNDKIESIVELSGSQCMIMKL